MRQRQAGIVWSGCSSADLDEGVDGRAGVGLGRGLAAEPQLELGPLPGRVAERSGLRVADARECDAAQAPRKAALDEPRRVALSTATAQALQPQPLVPSRSSTEVQSSAEG